MSQISIIAFCLKKTGLSLGIKSGINLYAIDMNSSDTDDPLDQAFVDVQRYYLKKELPTCAEVLTKILVPYGAQLKQWGGYWNIQRIEERVDTYDYREFDTNGVYVDEGSYSPVKDVGNIDNGALSWIAFPSMETVPGFGKIKLNYDLGVQENVLKNGDFRLKTIYSPFVNANIIVPDTTGFQLINFAGEITSNSYEILDEDNVAIELTSYGNAYIASNQTIVKMDISDRLKFKLRFKLPTYQFEFPYQKIKSKVKYGNYYLKSDGQWTLTDSNITYYCKDFGKYVEFEILTYQPDTSALYGLILQVTVYGSYILDADFITLALLKARVTTSLPIDSRTELKPSSSGGGVDSNYIYYYELQNNTSSESIPDIVRPNDYNAGTNPVQWILKTSKFVNIPFDNRYFIDKIVISYLPFGKELFKVNNTEIEAELNNPNDYTEEVFHGSLVEATQTDIINIIPSFRGGIINYVTVYNRNASQTYLGYLSDSARVGFVNWSRDNVSESRTLGDIQLRVLSAQYSRPWRKIMGTITGNGYLTPLDTIRETSDSNRFYYPISLDINDKRNQVSGEFVELISVTDGSGEPGEPGSGVGFTTGFTIGFNS